MPDVRADRLAPPPGPACADAALLPLVDAAFDYGRRGTAAARRLAVHCVTCPVASKCLQVGDDHQETWGVWGGTRRAGGSTVKRGHGSDSR